MAAPNEEEDRIKAVMAFCKLGKAQELQAAIGKNPELIHAKSPLVRAHSLALARGGAAHQRLTALFPSCVAERAAAPHGRRRFRAD